MRLLVFDAKLQIITSSLVIYTQPCGYAPSTMDRKTDHNYEFIENNVILKGPT